MSTRSSRRSMAATPPVSSIEIGGGSAKSRRPSSARQSLQPISNTNSTTTSSRPMSASISARAKARQLFERRNSERMLKASDSGSNRSLLGEKENQENSNNNNNSLLPPAAAAMTKKSSKPKKVHISTAKDEEHEPLENGTPPRAKHNDGNGAATPPSVTPYWRALELDQRPASPRLTRSSAKKTRRPKRGKAGAEEEDDNESVMSNAAQLFPMSFSPPDQKANALQEKKECDRKEKERAKRIARNRQQGNLLEFSPPGRSSKRTKKGGTQKYENEYMMDLSPGGGTTSSLDVDDDIHSIMDIKASTSSSSLGSRGSRASIQLTKAQMRQIALGDENFRALESEMFETKEELAKVEAKLEDSEQDAAALQHRIAEVEEELSEAQKEQQYLEAEYKDQAREQEERLQGEMAKQRELSSASNEDTQQTITELETELNEMNQQYEQAQQEVQKLETELTQKDAECAEIQESMEQRLAEQEDKLQAEQEEQKIEKEGNAAKETTIRQLSSVLEASKEKEHMLEEKIKTLQQEIQVAQSTASQHSNDEIAAMQVAKNKSETAVNAMQVELASLKECLTTKEESLVELKQTLETERASFKKQTQELEAKLLTFQNKATVLQQSNSGLEQKVESMQKAMEEMKATLTNSEQAQRELMEKLSRSTKQSEAQGSMANTLKEQLASEQTLRKTDADKLDQMGKDLSKAQSSIDHINRELQATHRQLQETAIERDQNRNRLVTFDARENELLKKLRSMDDIRRTLHNRVIQLSGNIRVFVRVRPIIQCEIEAVQKCAPSPSRPKSATQSRGIKRKQPMDANADECPFEFPGVADREESMTALQQQHQQVDGTSDDLTKQVIMATEPFKDRGGLKPRRKTWKFGFDHVFAPEQDQLDVWIATEPLVQSAIDGFNVCVFAYGMTGAGKTHTMLGSNQDPKQQGLIYRSVSKLFQAKRDLEAGTEGIVVDMSVELLEIYNENIRDLLSMKKQNPMDGGLRIQSNESVGNVVATADSEEDVLTILDLAQSRRCVKATNSNAESSRSHMIFTIHFDVLKRNSKTKALAPLRSGKLHICDLAGSERLGKSGSHGSLLKETQAINKSLMNLSNVIEKLQGGDAHVPYRDSKLTHLLQNSLGGDSKTLCVVCCNPLPEHFNESLCSLRFASKVSRVELKALSKVNV